ncbi:MAG: hypothetical protein LBR65_00625 [Culturomica sp.]|nr:hypothetical protein [Culturomica sp.]
MKKYILWALAFTGTLGACYEDDSIRADYSMLENITTIYKVNRDEVFTVKYMESKTFEPKFRYIRNVIDTIDFTPEEYAQYDYRWRLAINPGNADDTTRITIGTGYPLTTIVGHQPATGYNLLLEMTEKATGMKHQITWITNVEAGNVGSGLVVAYTHDGGATSDMALLRGYHYVSNSTDLLTPDSLGQMPEALIMYDVFSKANGGMPADGVISSVLASGKSTAIGAARVMDIVVRDKHYYRLDPNSFKITSSDGAMFNFRPVTWAPKNAYAVPANDMWNRIFFVNATSGHVSTSAPWMYTSLAASDTAFAIHPDVCVTTSSTGFGVAQYFDTKNGRIVGVGSANRVMLIQQPNMGCFALNALSAFEPLYAGLAENGRWTAAWVLKEKNSGKRYCYLVRNANSVSPYAAYGGAIMDMSGCTDFDKSTAWTTSLKTTGATYGRNPGNSWLYYAVGNKVYAVEIRSEDQSSGDAPLTPTAEHVFSIPAEEEITHLRWHLENGSVFYSRNNENRPQFNYNGTNYATPYIYTSRNRLLTIASYNSGTQEGKIYAVPCPAPAGGYLVGDGVSATTPDDPVWGQYIGQWGGFGKIIALGYRSY